MDGREVDDAAAQRLARSSDAVGSRVTLTLRRSPARRLDRPSRRRLRRLAAVSSPCPRIGRRAAVSPPSRSRLAAVSQPSRRRLAAVSPPSRRRLAAVSQPSPPRAARPEDGGCGSGRLAYPRRPRKRRGHDKPVRVGRLSASLKWAGSPRLSASAGGRRGGGGAGGEADPAGPVRDERYEKLSNAMGWGGGGSGGPRRQGRAECRPGGLPAGWRGRGTPSRDPREGSRVRLGEAAGGQRVCL